MAIFHIVMFEPKEGVDKASVGGKASERMLALSTKCIHPSTQKPYIKSLVGGKQNSTEPMAAPYTYGFVMEFENDEDRKYYLTEDPAHKEFVESMKTIVSGLGVFDFEAGSF